jgi:hypothetical protein
VSGTPVPTPPRRPRGRRRPPGRNRGSGCDRALAYSGTLPAGTPVLAGAAAGIAAATLTRRRAA